MKIIRITTDNEISIHDFPEGPYSEQNRMLRELIGPWCELYEHVRPRRLYTCLGASGEAKPGMEKGSCVSMLVDEEGYYHNLSVNLAGSYLYETDRHRDYILGNILIVGEVMTGDGIEFCGISQRQFDLLYPQLEKITMKVRKRA